jgi:hypothetical protein
LRFKELDEQLRPAGNSVNTESTGNLNIPRATVFGFRVILGAKRRGVD